jgi:hypothetical protein
LVTPTQEIVEMTQINSVENGGLRMVSREELRELFAQCLLVKRYQNKMRKLWQAFEGHTYIEWINTLLKFATILGKNKLLGEFLVTNGLGI